MITGVFSWITHAITTVQQRRPVILLFILMVFVLATILVPQVVLACGQTTGSCHCPGC